MPPAAVVVTSHDELLTRGLYAHKSEHFEFYPVPEFKLAASLLQESSAQCLILDLRTTLDGGHAADRFIEQILQTQPETLIVVLVREHYPEVIARRAACSSDRLLLDQGPHTPEHIHGVLTKAFGIALPASADAATSDVIMHSTPRDSGGATFGKVVFEGITRRFETRSPELKRMLEDLMIAASHDVTILLIGETGSGKTFLSNLIHEASPRRNEPFLHVACGALPRELIESELFGHVKGAFTSAHADKEGKFLAARKGTILLDEIDVLGPEQQVKLLKVIETGEFEPVGSNQTFRSQARLVVASNLELQPLVEQARFRPDLYYRLNMMKFEIPPLRKRKMDIIPMAKNFIARFQKKHSIPVHRIEEGLLDALLSYPWPGNVRELEHVIQRAVIYCRNGVLSKEQLPGHLLAGQVGPTNDPSVVLGRSATTSEQSLERQVSLTEKEIIEQALFKNNFSRTKTAQDLGISRVTLYNKMKKYEMLK